MTVRISGFLHTAVSWSRIFVGAIRSDCSRQRCWSISQRQSSHVQQRRDPSRSTAIADLCQGITLGMDLMSPFDLTFLLLGSTASSCLVLHAAILICIMALDDDGPPMLVDTAVDGETDDKVQQVQETAKVPISIITGEHYRPTSHFEIISSSELTLCRLSRSWQDHPTQPYSYRSAWQEDRCNPERLVVSLSLTPY